MTSEQIDKFLTPEILATKQVKVSFKSRNMVKALFINERDYNDLKVKNFWRLVTEANIEGWKKTKDLNLSRLFHGGEFTKLAAD